MVVVSYSLNLSSAAVSGLNYRSIVWRYSGSYGISPKYRLIDRYTIYRSIAIPSSIDIERSQVSRYFDISSIEPALSDYIPYDIFNLVNRTMIACHGDNHCSMEHGHHNYPQLTSDIFYSLSRLHQHHVSLKNVLFYNITGYLISFGTFYSLYMQDMTSWFY